MSQAPQDHRPNSSGSSVTQVERGDSQHAESRLKQDHPAVAGEDVLEQSPAVGESRSNQAEEASEKVVHNDPDVIEFDGPEDPLNPMVRGTFVSSPTCQLLAEHISCIRFLPELVFAEKAVPDCSFIRHNFNRVRLVSILPH